MSLVFSFLLLTFLVLFQTSLLPWNFAFAVIVLYDLFVEKLPNLNWLIVVSLLVSLFGNLNPGIVVIGFTASFLLLELLARLLPVNRLTKIFLVILALPLAEISLRFLSGSLR